jgi:hypothetical protein
MLIDVETRRQITNVPHDREFQILRKRLTPEEFRAAVGRINELIDDAGAEIATAGWLPGHDWTGTPFEPIYTKGTGRNYGMAARLFGLLVWYVVMQRPERWASGRDEKNKDIGSRTYFRIGPR